MHCKGHQKGNTKQEMGNRLADLEAKKVTEKEQVQTLALTPDGKPITWGTNIPYSKENLTGSKCSVEKQLLHYF